MLSWSRCDRNRGTTRRPWQPSVPPFGRATSRGEGFDPSISEAWDARTCVRSSRHVRRWPRGPTGWMREAVLLSLEFELDVIDGTPEPILTGLIRLHDRMSSLAGVSSGVTVGRIVAAADVRARGAPPQVDPGPTVAQAVDAPGPLASFVAIESRCVQMSAIDTLTRLAGPGCRPGRRGRQRLHGSAGTR